MWANMLFVVVNQPNSINANHRGRLRVSVSAMCLDDVKMYGKRPMKLLTRRKVKSVISRMVLPEGDLEPSRVLNSR